MSAVEKERKFSRSSNACEKFSLAYDLHFDGERFQKNWGLKALEVLARVGDYRSMCVYGLQLHDLLASGDPDRAAFHWFALAGIHGALEHVSIEHDQNWIRWALAMKSDDPRAESLAFDSFLERYPNDSRSLEVSRWKEAAAMQFLEAEISIARGLFSRGEVFAPVVRFESNLRLKSLQSSKNFPQFVLETVRYRELFRSKLEKIEDKKLRMWLRIEGNARLDRNEVARRIRAENCSDLDKVKTQWPQFAVSPKMKEFRALCR